MTADDKRRSVERAFAILLDCIRDAQVEAIKSGIYPKEVWLGPNEIRIFEAEMNWQLAEGRLVWGGEVAQRAIRGDMEGAEVMGLKTRKSVSDGVRVGISWPEKV